jgi:hypothetical protein
MMNKTENTLYILQNLSSTESKDLDYAEIDVYYEDEQGDEGAAQYDMPTIADDAISTINELQSKIAELEKATSYLVAVDLKGDAIVMANARRLIKANVRTSNGRLYSELFGTGCGSGRSACRELGLNPDCNKTSYEEMCNHINLKSPKEQD